MYTLGSDFSKFHRDFVKLSQGEISRLRSLKKLNLKRIEKGLEKYNEDQSKKLKIIDTRDVYKTICSICIFLSFCKLKKTHRSGFFT